MPLRKYGITCNALVAGSNPAAGANDRIQKSPQGLFCILECSGEKAIGIAFVQDSKDFSMTSLRVRKVPAAVAENPAAYLNGKSVLTQ